MAYRTRHARRVVRKSRRNLITTVIICLLLLYVTVNWILPALINGVGTIKNIGQTKKTIHQVSENPTLAPPVLSIPYEATNSAEIKIKGYATSNSQVKIYIDNELVDTTESNSEGSFITKFVTLNLGVNKIYGKTVDEKDTESLPSKEIKVTYVNEKPKLEVTEPNDGREITGGDKKVRVSGKTDPANQVFVNGGLVVVNSDGNFSSDIPINEGENSITPINEGENSITVRSQDKAGNSTEATRKVIWKP
jgi:hypothetical protein